MDGNTRIPKTLHYIWVGLKPLTPLARRCVESWKAFAPGYEVRFWNEENAPMQHPYIRAMYAKKKWAFVSDYIRFWALEREGGIYLDTDMELLKPLDGFLNDGMFVGRSKSGHIESSIIGAVPHHPAIGAALAFYDGDTGFSIANTSPIIISSAIEKEGSGQVHVYGPSYFHPCDAGEACGPDALKDAYARHHWAESWVPFAAARKLARAAGLMPALKRIAGI